MNLRAASAAAVAAALVIAGCGSDEPGTSATQTSVAPSDTTVPTTTNEASTTTTVTTPPETTPPTSAAPSTTAATEPAVFDFSTGIGAEGWQVVNDTVMGGVSNGDATWADGVLTFSGALSLENNGGFASIRSPRVDAQAAAAWATRSGIRVEADGDGRTWTVELRINGDSGGWITTFATLPAATTVVELPWSSFEPVTRFLEPREASVPLDPTRLVTVAFFLVDGIEGPFRLDLRSIG